MEPKVRMLAVVCLAGLMGQEVLAQAKITSTGRIYRPATPTETQEPTSVSEQREQGEASEPEQIEEVPQTEESDGRRTRNELNLICLGAGAANKTDVATASGTSSGTAMGSHGNFATYQGNSNATVVNRRSEAFRDQVSIRMTHEDGRLRMPRVMLPLLRGGKDGWFKLKNIKYTPGEITATVAVNFMNKPQLRLDRYSGAISISGKAGNYTGLCEKFNPKAMKRAF